MGLAMHQGGGGGGKGGMATHMREFQGPDNDHDDALRSRLTTSRVFEGLVRKGASAAASSTCRECACVGALFSRILLTRSSTNWKPSSRSGSRKLASIACPEPSHRSESCDCLSCLSARASRACRILCAFRCMAAMAGVHSRPGCRLAEDAGPAGTADAAADSASRPGRALKDGRLSAAGLADDAVCNPC